MFNLLVVVACRQEELLLSAIITHGERFVQTHGIHLMQQLFASSWDIHHLVGIPSHTHFCTQFIYGALEWTMHYFIMLNYLSGVQSASAYYSLYTRRPTSVTMYLGSVHCDGSESSLLNCNHTQSSFSDGYCEGGNFGDVVCQGM